MPEELLCSISVYMTSTLFLLRYCVYGDVFVLLLNVMRRLSDPLTIFWCNRGSKGKSGI